MSDYGFKAINKGLGVQIDGHYRNFALGTTASKFRPSGGLNWVIVDIPETAVTDAPLVTMKALTAPLQTVDAVDSLYPVGSINRCFVTFGPMQAFTTEIQQFNMGINKTTGYGLIINNASGDTVFSSEDKHFHPLAQYEATLGHPYTITGDMGASIDITVRDADNNYFFLSPAVEQRENAFTPPGKDITKRGFRKIDSTTIRVQIYKYNIPFGAGQNGVMWPATFNLIECRKE